MKQWVVVVGGTNMDVVARTSAPLVPAPATPATRRISPGGVGRNVAACLGLLGAPVRLVSAVGDDAFGDEALRVTAACGADVAPYAGRRDAPAPTPRCSTTDGELVAAVSDMAIVDELRARHGRTSTDAAPRRARRQPRRAAQAAAGRRRGRGRRRPARLRAGLGRRRPARLADLVQRPVPRHAQQRRARRPDRSPPADWRRAVADLHERGVEYVWVRQRRRGLGTCSRRRAPSTCPPCR